MHAGNFNFTCKSFGRVDSECINMSSWALMRHNICAFEWHSNLFTNLPGSNWKVPFKQQRVPIRDVGNGMLGHVKCVTSWISCMFAFYCETFNFPQLSLSGLFLNVLSFSQHCCKRAMYFRNLWKPFNRTFKLHCKQCLHRKMDFPQISSMFFLSTDQTRIYQIVSTHTLTITQLHVV